MPPRPRAPNACHACRDRKVKCDVSSSGIPCQNCIRAKIDCCVLARKKRATRHGKGPSASLTGIHVFEADTVTPCEVQGSEKSSGQLAHPRRGNANLRERSSAVSLPVHEGDSIQDHLATYITPLRHDLDPDVLCLLQRKKALSLPQPAAREELLGAFVCHVHPFLPVLDLEYFLDSVQGEHDDKKVSLVLFQAVMFAGTGFVDIEYLRAEGFESRKEARRSFFDRVRLLFDSDVELAPITLVQVLLLMTYWYDKPTDIKGRSHWMAVALSFANNIGLGQQSELVGLSPGEQKHRRRLWWCLLMRDKLISMSELRPSSICREEADFPSLLPDDFECLAFAGALKKFSRDDDSRQWVVLRHLCVEKIKLCIIIGRILRTQYDSKSFQHASSAEATISLVPNLSPTVLAEFVARDQEVRKWSSDMCPITSGLVTEDLWRSCNTVSVHCTSLEMLYYTVLGLVHRPQVLSRPPMDSAAEAIQDFSRKTLRESAVRVTQISKVFNDANLLRFLPPIGVTALLASAVQHIKDSESSAPSIRSAATQGLDHTIQSLIRLQDIYCSADHAMAFIQLIGNKTVTDTSPDLSQVTVFPLFRDELLHYPPPKHPNSSCTQTSQDIYDPKVNLLSSYQLHAAIDATLIEPCETDDVDLEALLALSDSSVVHHQYNVDMTDNGTTS